MSVELVAVLKLRDEMTSGLKKAATAATIGFAAITAGAVASVKVFADFDTAIRKTGAIAGASTSELQMLSDAALDMGQKTSKGATEVANSMTSLAAAGFNVNDVMGAMPGIIAASEASGESLAVASDTVASALNIWGLEAENSTHIADVLAMAANVSAAGIQDLGYAFKYAGGPAAALGVSLEETAAAIGILSNSGIDGSSAGTALRASLMALNNPAKAQEKIMQKLGFSVKDSNNEFKSLATMIGDMQKATEHMTEADKVATLGKLVGTEAVSGFLALMKAGPAEIDKMTASLVNSDGVAEKTAKDMMGGIGGALEQAGGAIETAMILIGDAFKPVVIQFAEFIAAADFSTVIGYAQSLGEKLAEIGSYVVSNWPQIVDTIKNVIAVVIAVSAAVAAFKGVMAGMTIIGIVTTLFRAYRTGTLLATVAQMGLNTAMLLSPITWIAAGIALVVGAAVLMALKMREAGGSWAVVWQQIKKGAGDSINFVVDKINWMIGVFNKIPGVNIPLVPKVDWGNYYAGPTSNHVIQTQETSVKGVTLASHHGGLDEVPYNSYAANLHKGEKVLTRQEADDYRNGQGNGGGIVVNVSGVTINNEMDVDTFAYKLALGIQRAVV